MTPTEASVLAVFYCFVVGLIYKELKLKEIPKILVDTMKQTVVIMFIIGIASVISWIVTKESRWTWPKIRLTLTFPLIRGKRPPEWR